MAKLSALSCFVFFRKIYGGKGGIEREKGFVKENEGGIGKERKKGDCEEGREIEGDNERGRKTEKGMEKDEAKEKRTEIIRLLI